MNIETIRKLYQVIDRLDLGGLMEHFSDDAVLLMGRGEPFHGRKEISAALDELFCELDGVHHQVHDVWQPAGKTNDIFVSHADAYFRVRGCPGATLVRGALIVRVQDGLITCARMLYDLSPVWEAARAPDRVFEASYESFPASDSPGWTP